MLNGVKFFKYISRMPEGATPAEIAMVRAVRRAAEANVDYPVFGIWPDNYVEGDVESYSNIVRREGFDRVYTVLPDAVGYFVFESKLFRQWEKCGWDAVGWTSIDIRDPHFDGKIIPILVYGIVGWKIIYVRDSTFDGEKVPVAVAYEYMG